MSTASIAAIESRLAEIQQRFIPATSNTAVQGGNFANVLGGILGSGLNVDSTSNITARTTSKLVSSADVITEAKKYLGVPYVWGGEDASGMDCSGLVQTAYKTLGISLPRVAADQARQGESVASLAQAKPGDLVAFGSPVDHIGIYVGDNKMIVAPRRGDVVKIQDIYKSPTAIRRIIPEETTTTAGGSLAAFVSGGSSITSSNAIAVSLSSRFDSLFTQAGAKYGISPNLLAAVAKQESGFNPSAVSKAGAQGLMQIMPGTAKGLGVDALNPAEAVDGAARMLSGLVKKFGSTELALAGYNAGPGAVQQYGGIPPYKETQNYVRNVMSLARSA